MQNDPDQLTEAIRNCADGFVVSQAQHKAAIGLVDRIIVDPHSVDDKLFIELRQHFSEEEIIELICASSLFTWAGTLNTALRVETGADSPYGSELAQLTPFRGMNVAWSSPNFLTQAHTGLGPRVVCSLSRMPTMSQVCALSSPQLGTCADKLYACPLIHLR